MRAHLQVVFAVDHGIPGVVRGGPQDVAGVQQPAQHRHFALHGGERHRDAPAERHAQVDLRQVGVALQVRVAGGEEHADEAQADGQPVQGQHQAERHQHQYREQGQRGAATDRAGGQRTRLGAFHMRVEPAVGIVVDDATGRAGQPHASGEHEQRPQRRQATGGQPQRPPGGPQQQQRADRAISAHQTPVMPPTRRRRRLRRSEGGISHGDRILLPLRQGFARGGRFVRRNWIECPSRTASWRCDARPGTGRWRGGSTTRP